jgi:glucuronoarabinoxylan endo-1,4-beta-xylanase
MNIKSPSIARVLAILFLFIGASKMSAQAETKLIIDPTETRQTVTGFGASLAYYESWLNAHPRKSEVYDLIFRELSLDILRVRNAYGYDPDMVGRVKEYMNAAKASLGHPIELLSTSWGPMGSLKNTGDRKNGGTLRYTAGPGGVVFDYAGFASWWKESLEEYAAQGIMPDYISIQNEPDFSATWESCLLNPRETINASDTIAGYNKALDVVYDTVSKLSDRPLILGPETVGIGYNRVQNYVNALDLSKLDGIAHHLYHGVDENDPWSSDKFTELGDYHPDVPHFQTEYSRGDWFSLAGLIYKSFQDEEVEAYLYWGLIWGEKNGLVALEHPWDQSKWTDPKGYIINQEYYAFKQFSAFIHPGWKRIETLVEEEDLKLLTFVSPDMDSMSCVVINRSESENLSVHVDIPGYRISESAVYSTSATEECILKGALIDSTMTVLPRSISTVDMRIMSYDPADDTEAPSIPAGVGISDLSTSSLSLAWAPSTDNIGVAGYKIYVDGVLHGTNGDTIYMLTGLDHSTSFEITVSAFDNAQNESEKSSPVTGITMAPDTEAPVVEVTDSIYQKGLAEIVSSEAGVVYLVPGGTEKELDSIRETAIDSIEVEAATPVSMPIGGLENGDCWFFATDSAENISEPAVLTVLGVGLEPSVVFHFNLYPNPFTEQTTLHFSLKREQEMWITLMDSQGRVIRKEALGHLNAGSQQLMLERRGLPDGIYFFKLENSRAEGPAGRIVIQD